MNVPYGLLPEYLYWLAHLIYFPLLGLAVYTAPWRDLRADSQRIHVFLGFCVSLLLLWQLKAGLQPEMGYHLLGGTLFLLLFGWQLAFIGMSGVLVGTIINGDVQFASFSLNALVTVVLPVLVSHGLLRFAVRYLPHHFFVYVIGNAFLTGGLTMFLTVMSASMLMSPYGHGELLDKYLPFAPLMGFAEAFFTGMLAAGLVLMRPEWVRTFDDRMYLSGK